MGFERVDLDARAGVLTAAISSSTTKTELHDLVDALPDESLPAAAILLRRAQDPVAAELDAAPFSEEELTEEDLRVIEQARKEPAIPWEKAKAELKSD